MPYISSAFVSEALESARRRGVDIAEVLAKAGIDTPGSGEVSDVQFGALWLAITDALEDEFFGNAARAMRPGSFTLMGHAVRDAATVEIAVRRALRFLRAAIDEPYGVLETQGGVAQIALYDSRKDRSAFTYRTFWVILHGLTCWLARHRIVPLGLALTCEAPREAPDYGQFFGAPVVFGAEQGWMRYDAAYLKRPARRSEAALKRFLRQAPGIFLTGYRYEDGPAGQVAAILAQTSPLDWPGFAGVAHALGQSPATLRRKLSAQGTSFRAIKAQMQQDQAKRLLRQSPLSVAEIAHQLGYAEPSAFFRAFKGWTGRSPDAWRISSGRS